MDSSFSGNSCTFCLAGSSFVSTTKACAACVDGTYQNQNDAESVTCSAWTKCTAGTYGSSPTNKMNRVCYPCDKGKKHNVIFVRSVLNLIPKLRVAKIAEQADTKYKLVLQMSSAVLVLLDVVLEQEKRLLVRHRLIVFVVKTIVLVLMVSKLLELLVHLMVPVFVHCAPVNITKLVILVIRVLLVLLRVDLVLD